MGDNSIQVVFRFRGEPPGVEQSDWILTPDAKGLQLGPGKNPERKFEFDAVLGQNTQQEEVYDNHAKMAIDWFMKGFNSTIFAYGQSGSGKTYSMVGPEEVVEQLMKNCQNIPEQVAQVFGIIPRSILTIFTMINDGVEKGTQFQLKCQYLEVYNETIQDILVTPVATNLKIREFPGQGMAVVGAEEKPITTPEQVFECLANGQKNRAVCATGANARSSRSHTVFVLTIEQKTKDGIVKASKLNLVDLAGSEKLSKAQTTGQQLEETKKINQSLTCLGMCIMALTGKSKQHVPFRDSKLTMMLKESLGGNSKTLMMCTGSVLTSNEEETVSSLRFAQRAKKIVNKAKNNVKRSVAELEALVESLKKEIAMLRAQLKKAGVAVQGDPELEGEMADVDEPTVEEISAVQADEDIQFKFTELESKFNLMQAAKDEEIENLKLQLEKAALSGESVREVEKLRIQLEETEREVEKEKLRYETRVVELDNRIVEYRDRYVVAEEERTKVEQERKVIIQQIRVLQTQVEEKEVVTQKLQQQIVYQMQEKTVTKEADVESKLIAMRDSYDKELQRITEDRNRVKNERDTLERSNEELQEELARLRKQVALQESSVNKATEELIQNRLELGKLDRANQQTAQRLKEALQTIAELKAQIQRLSREQQAAPDQNVICKKVTINQGLFGQHMLKRTNNAFIQKAIEEAQRAQQIFEDLNRPKEEKKQEAPEEIKDDVPSPVNMKQTQQLAFDDDSSDGELN